MTQLTLLKCPSFFTSQLLITCMTAKQCCSYEIHINKNGQQKQMQMNICHTLELDLTVNKNHHFKAPIHSCSTCDVTWMDLLYNRNVHIITMNNVSTRLTITAIEQSTLPCASLNSQTNKQPSNFELLSTKMAQWLRHEFQVCYSFS